MITGIVIYSIIRINCNGGVFGFLWGGVGKKRVVNIEKKDHGRRIK